MADDLFTDIVKFLQMFSDWTIDSHSQIFTGDFKYSCKFEIGCKQSCL